MFYGVYRLSPLERVRAGCRIRKGLSRCRICHDVRRGQAGACGVGGSGGVSWNVLEVDRRVGRFVAGPDLHMVTSRSSSLSSAISPRAADPNRMIRSGSSPETTASIAVRSSSPSTPPLVPVRLQDRSIPGCAGGDRGLAGLWSVALVREARCGRRAGGRSVSGPRGGFTMAQSRRVRCDDRRNRRRGATALGCSGIRAGRQGEGS